MWRELSGAGPNELRRAAGRDAKLMVRPRRRRTGPTRDISGEIILLTGDIFQEIIRVY
jgi:hypothetical protein